MSKTSKKKKIIQELERLKAEVNSYRKRPPRDLKKHTCELSCDGTKDLVITDPCYLFNGDEWRDVIELFHGMGTVNGALAPQELEHAGLKMVIADTLWGDWMCTLDDKRHTRFGTFTADAGCVCALQLSYREAMTRLKGIPTQCWCRIPKFEGTVRICHQNRRCWIEGRGSFRDGLLTAFKSKQIG